MRTSKYLLCFLILAGAFLCSSCFSQGKVSEIQDSVKFVSIGAGRGDTLLIGYDSAFILNTRTYNLYRDSYLKIKKGNPSVKALMDNYESTISLQDSMLKDKEQFYQLLKTNFDSL